MADLTRHLVNDAWGTSCTELDKDANPDALLAYRNNSSVPWVVLGDKFDTYCFHRNVANEYAGGEGHLSVYGWVFTIFCTWSGFLMLFVGIFWIINFPKKIAMQWRSIRGRRAAPAAREQLLDQQA